jgi:hypothetical protein
MEDPMRACLSLLLLLAAAPASAVMTTTAGLSALEYSLRDLRPQDTDAPSVTLSGFSSGSVFSAARDIASGRRDAWFTDAVHGYGDWSASVYPDPPSSRVEGHAIWEDNFFWTYGVGFADLLGPRSSAVISREKTSFGFELSPHTAIDWSIYYILDVRADRDAQATREDMAYAKVVVDAGGRQTLRIEAYANPDLGSDFVRREGVFTFSFVNDSDTNRSYQDNRFLAVSGVRPAALVPEPSTCALMLAGLGTVTLAARRRAERPRES